MHINLSGKTAIITASTAGIGLATAKGLAATGASVIVNGCTREGVDRAVKYVPDSESRNNISVSRLECAPIARGILKR